MTAAWQHTLFAASVRNPQQLSTHLFNTITHCAARITHHAARSTHRDAPVQLHRARQDAGTEAKAQANPVSASAVL